MNRKEFQLAGINDPRTLIQMSDEELDIIYKYIPTGDLLFKRAFDAGKLWPDTDGDYKIRVSLNHILSPRDGDITDEEVMALINDTSLFSKSCKHACVAWVGKNGINRMNEINYNIKLALDIGRL